MQEISWHCPFHYLPIRKIFETADIRIQSPLHPPPHPPAKGLPVSKVHLLCGKPLLSTSLRLYCIPPPPPPPIITPNLLSSSAGNCPNAYYSVIFSTISPKMISVFLILHFVPNRTSVLSILSFFSHFPHPPFSCTCPFYLLTFLGRSPPTFPPYVFQFYPFF